MLINGPPVIEAIGINNGEIKIIENAIEKAQFKINVLL